MPNRHTVAHGLIGRVAQMPPFFCCLFVPLMYAYHRRATNSDKRATLLLLNGVYVANKAHSTPKVVTSQL